MKGKTLVGAGNNISNQQKPGGALTPAEAAKECENAAQKSGNGTPIKIRYPFGDEGSTLKIPTHITDNLSTFTLSPRKTPQKALHTSADVHITTPRQSNDNGLEAKVLLNSSAIPDNDKDTSKNKITNPFGGELKVTAATGTNNPGYGYQLTLTGLPTSPCISLGTLNLGTSTAGYAISNNGNGKPGFPNGNDKGPITPATAATQCSGDSHFNAQKW